MPRNPVAALAVLWAGLAVILCLLQSLLQQLDPLQRLTTMHREWEKRSKQLKTWIDDQIQASNVEGVNPRKDVDLTVNTDCEDLLVFLGDVIEFGSQDLSLLLDSAISGLGGGSWQASLVVVELALL